MTFYKVGMIQIPFLNIDDFLNNFNISTREHIGYGRDCAFYTKKLHIPCFIIIRDPIAHFIDIYFNEYARNNLHLNASYFNTINDFVEHIYLIYKSNKPYTYKYANKIYNIFSQQTDYYSNGNPAKTFLLQNAEIEMIELFLKNTFGLGDKKRVNINKTLLFNPRDIVLTEKSITMLNEIYKTDFILYKRLVSKKKIYSRLTSL